MKSFRILYYLIFILIFEIPMNGQGIQYYYYEMSFEDTSHFHRLDFFPDSSQEFSWRIMQPEKHVLSNAYSGSNVIITQAYNVDDTISFTIIHRAEQGYELGGVFSLSGYFQSDCDSLSDFGVIELSIDKGKSWTDLLDSNFADWGFKKPVLTGLNEWTNFSVLIGINETLNFSDTVLIKFSFISDESDTERGGLMYDDICIEDFYEGIESSIGDNFNSYVFPNPGNNIIRIIFDSWQSEEYSVVIMNSMGQIVNITPAQIEEYPEIDVSKFSDGIYIYRLFLKESGRMSCGKFIVR